MDLNFMDFEIPLLQALVKFGGKAKPKDVYPVVEKIMGLNPKDYQKNMKNTKARSLNGRIKQLGHVNTLSGKIN
jgi:hypothetical protein